MTLRLAAAAVVIAVAVAACSGDSPESGDNASSDTPVTVGAPGAPEFEPIQTMDTEAGPRPLLQWAPVDGADEYHVSVFAASGDAYWGWSGTETQVNVGGISDPDAVGPHVFEAMTWVVMASTMDGEVLAMSRPATLTP